uniref:Ankyrin repeat, SAM and basic leucine zipper domain-containing protein 1 n=1 Tax=Petromyzon marinus TaxID=7757 RepID=A0AAJ7XAC5_PETMA|nr:ankyrin repeat, SAM and basic leucine zipper domain-containing protein 1 isoform X2 [Petromyzon marinus]
MEVRPAGSEDDDYDDDYDDDQWDWGDPPRVPLAVELPPWTREHNIDPTGRARTASGSPASGGGHCRGENAERAGARKAFAAGKPCLVAKVGAARRDAMGGSSSSSGVRTRRAAVVRAEGRLLSLEDTRAAAMAGNQELVCEALDAGVDVNAVLSSGWSLLMYAAVCANPALVKVLLARGASAHFATEGGYTVLMAACAPSHRPAGDAVACAAQLLRHALDTNVTDRMGMSAVMYAARDGYQDSVQLLGQHSTDVNLQDQHGWTAPAIEALPSARLQALHWAASRGHEACRRRLEELGADVAIKTNGGFSAEELALQFSKVQIVLESYKESGTCKFTAPTNKISAVSTKALELKIRNKLKLDDLKQFLFGLDLGHLVPLFQAREVTLSSLLTMSDQELSELGAMQTGEQRKILAATHKLHMSRWESGSIPDITKLPVSFEGTITLLVNMELQCNYMQSSLEYLCKHSMSDLSLLKPVKIASLKRWETTDDKAGRRPGRCGVQFHAAAARSDGARNERRPGPAPASGHAAQLRAGVPHGFADACRFHRLETEAPLRVARGSRGAAVAPRRGRRGRRRAPRLEARLCRLERLRASGPRLTTGGQGPAGLGWAGGGGALRIFR